MKKSLKVTFIIIIIFILVIGGAGGYYYMKKYSPGTQRADLYNYFNNSIEEEGRSPSIIIQDQVIEEKALLEAGNYYIEIDVVKSYLNEKFYWDENENLLIITTANEVIKVNPDSNSYYVDGSENQVQDNILYIEEESVYILAEFVKMYSEIDYETYENPNRIWIKNTWGSLEVATVKKDSEIRYRAGVKSEILADVKEGDSLYIIEEEGSWKKVYLEGGFIGYIKNSKISGVEEKEFSPEYSEPEYTNISIGDNINLGWHAIYGNGVEDNSEMTEIVSQTSGLDVISPTWFYFSSSTGAIASLADAQYVSKAHSMGLDVWGTIQDFNAGSDGVLYVDNILPYTSKREKMEDDLIALAIGYNLDGISINFEQFSSENGEHYIQFLREMSIKCRENNIVLSSVNYVSVPWRDYYQREEQGEIIDYFIVMAYPEYDGVDGQAGPECSLPYLKESTDNIILEVDPSKVIMAIPFYSVRWNGEGESLKRSSRTMKRVEYELGLVGATKTWQEEFGVNYAEYTQDGVDYRIWIDDEQSIEEKVKLLSEYEIAGVAYWALGQEKADVWDSIVKYID